MNKQPPERVELYSEGVLDVHHVFPTIQGEGPFAGTPAVFIRLAGCNLQCPWCDTDYTSRREHQAPARILATVAGFRPVAPLPTGDVQTAPAPRQAPLRPLVVITGGEPFRQNLGPLVRALSAAGYLVQIETNGTLHDPFFPYQLATVVCSPKTPRVHPRLVPHLAALKYVLDADSVDPEDGLPASTMGAAWRVFRPGADFIGEIYVQPLDVSGDSGDGFAASSFLLNPENQRHTSAAVASAVKHGYRLCIQTHKLTGLE